MTKEENTRPLSSTETTRVNSPESMNPRESKSIVKDIASKAVDQIESIVLSAFHESPVYQQDNHYILSGYRGELQSFQRCFESLWYLHNETGRNSASYC